MGIQETSGAAKVICDGSAISHACDKKAGAITSAAGHYGDAKAGDLISFDVRGGKRSWLYLLWDFKMNSLDSE